MKGEVLCIDIGTTSLKAAFLDAGSTPSVSRQCYSSDSENVADEWMFSLKSALAELSGLSEKNIDAICVSGNGPTLVLDSASKEEFGHAGFQPSLCPPFRSRSIAFGNFGAPSAHALTFMYDRQIPQYLSEDYRNLSMAIDTHSLFLPRLFALKKLFPRSWDKSRHVFSGPEYLIYQLSGKCATILPEKRYLSAYWTKKELEGLGFTEKDSEKLPDFVESGKIIGHLQKNAADFLGLKEGIPVVGGGPDFTVALLGTGTVFPGSLCDRAGSSEGINLCTSKPIPSEGIRTLPSPAPGLWNASVLISAETKNRADHIQAFVSAVEKLKKAALDAGETFPDSMTITGGQSFDKKLLEQKQQASGLKILPARCPDAELIGNLILARFALGDYDTLSQAVKALT